MPGQAGMIANVIPGLLRIPPGEGHERQEKNYQDFF